MINIIAFENRYAEQVAKIYHMAIRDIAACDYKPEQLSAWSTAPRSAKHWKYRLTRTQAWLAVDDTKGTGEDCVGFINLETHFKERGYIDSLYVLPEYQHQGLATQLYHQLEVWALAQGYLQLSTDASLLSKQLFINQGFCLIHKTYQQKSGQIIKGFLMKKPLAIISDPNLRTSDAG